MSSLLDRDFWQIKRTAGGELASGTKWHHLDEVTCKSRWAEGRALNLLSLTDEDPTPDPEPFCKRCKARRALKVEAARV